MSLKLFTVPYYRKLLRVNKGKMFFYGKSVINKNVAELKVTNEFPFAALIIYKILYVHV